MYNHHFGHGYHAQEEESPQHTHPQHGMMQEDLHHHHHQVRYHHEPQLYHPPPEFHSNSFHPPPEFHSSSFHHPSAAPPPYPPPPFPYPPPPPFQLPPTPSSFPPPPPPHFLSSYASDTAPPPPPFSASCPPHHGLPLDSSFRERSNSFIAHSAFDNVSHYPPVLHRTPSSQEQNPEPSVTGFSRSASDGKKSSFREFPEVTLQESALPKSAYPHREVELPRGQLVRVFCKSNRSYNLSVRDHRVMMVKADTLNESQQWVRDDRFALRVKDSYGHPAFMLINKASKKVLRHAKGELQELQLVDYEPGMQDDDLLWTESQDFGEGFKTVRMASNTLLNMTVGLHGRGAIEEGSPIILDTWHKKDNQLWKIFPL